MPAAARLTDLHTCPITTPQPHVGGVITGPGCPTVMIGGMPAARLGDMLACAGPPGMIVTGETTVLIGGMPAARMTDLTAHGGVVTTGHPTVQIGMTPQAAALQAASGQGSMFCEKCPT